MNPAPLLHNSADRVMCGGQGPADAADFLAYLQDVGCWPRFLDSDIGYCCLKRTDQHGYLTTEDPLTVYCGPIEIGIPYAVISYESAEDLLNDGWEID